MINDRFVEAPPRRRRHYHHRRRRRHRHGSRPLGVWSPN